MSAKSLPDLEDIEKTTIVDNKVDVDVLMIINNMISGSKSWYPFIREMRESQEKRGFNKILYVVKEFMESVELVVGLDGHQKKLFVMKALEVMLAKSGVSQLTRDIVVDISGELIDLLIVASRGLLRLNHINGDTCCLIV
jgi:hypothetical protein